MTTSIVTKVYKNLIIGPRTVFFIFDDFGNLLTSNIWKVRIQFQENRNTLSFLIFEKNTVLVQYKKNIRPEPENSRGFFLRIQDTPRIWQKWKIPNIGPTVVSREIKLFSLAWKWAKMVHFEVDNLYSTLSILWSDLEN